MPINNKVKQAISDIKNGKMIIITDDEYRENEGDIVIAAEKVTQQIMTFIIKEASGLVCLSLDQELADKFGLNLMVQNNQESMKTAFTVSIDAKHNIKTGISAFDRTQTILTIVDDKASIDDIVKPGHIFPLIAKKNGVIDRPGHTEASVTMARLAGLKPAAVICEIIGENGEMLIGKNLKNFALRNQLTQISIKEIIDYLNG